MTKEFRYHPIRRILVPTDFSPNASGALRYAAALAARLRCRLIVFHSVHLPVPAGSPGISFTISEAGLEDVRVRLQSMKEDLLTEFPGVEVDTNTSMGFAVDEIIGFCETRRADLIVMGTKGAHGLGEILIGSNTAEVIARSSCPVLAVPVQAGPANIRKIVFATNYSDHDFRSIFLLTEIFKPWNPEIIVVHADETGELRQENTQFEWFRSQVSAGISYDKFNFNLIEGGRTEQAISDFAREAGADIISVSTRRRSLFERLVSRSVTRKFAYHTEIPLLAFHSDPDTTPLF